MFKTIFNKLSLYFKPDALINAIRNEDTEKVKSLLDLGAKIDPAIYKNSDMGLLATALKFEHKEITALLLDHGADMYAADKLSGLRPIDQILQYRALKPEILNLFIEKGFDVKKMIDEEPKWTVLHLAADRGTPAIIEILLNAGADINAQTIYGETPLHRASSLRVGAPVAKSLIKNGAKTNIIDNYGRTAQQVAKQHQFNDIVNLFKQKTEAIPAPAIVPPAPPQA